ncbi:L-threonylcarbamoyladenylate synthase [Lewinella sp. LCG006]|uniref:L-threonylcarbamoyladenylate synthase n=1 Tax=Lewinella sp. LCG006 TaxID=3231911 RepID=UPI00345F629C
MITTNLATAKQALIANEIIAIPTETVYGLAGNAYSETAIKKIFELKQRPFYNPLIVHVKSAAFLSQVATDIPAAAEKMAKNFWPGPLTLILKKQPNIPDLVTAGKETVAVRVPNHPTTLNLLAQLDFPLAAPSANPFGAISPTTAEHVDNYFKNTLSVVLDGGRCEKGVESTIIGFEDDQPILFRHGAISVEEIEKVIGKVRVRTSGNDTDVSAPGMLSRHYSPATNTHLTDNVGEYIKMFQHQKIGLLLFKDTITDNSIAHQEVLSPAGDLAEAAKELYAALHRLDKLDLDVIIAERFPDNGLGKTINDRLQRAVESE